MTTPDSNDAVDDRLIDRIVDGGMSSAELRAAVACLDRDVSAWKRCALGFIEGQCLSESFRLVGEPAREPLVGRISIRLSTDHRAPARRGWLLGPVAAGIVAASFALGWLGRSVQTRSTTTETRLVQSGRDRDTKGTEAISEQADAASARPEPLPRPVSWRSDGNRVPTVNEVVRSVGHLHIGGDRSGADVPILAGPGINEQWLRNQPLPVTEHGQVALERQGFRVDQRRQFITTTLADGRRVTIPIDQVQIRYTGNHPL